MSRLSAMRNLVEAATAAVRLKSMHLTRKVRRVVSLAAHRMLAAETERQLEKALAGVFEVQVRGMVEELKEMGGEKAKPGTSAQSLAKQVFNPNEWKGRLVDAALPVMAVGMAESAVQNLRLVGVEIRKTEKATTATEWLAKHSSEWDELLGPVQAAGLPIDLLTELPDWMKKYIMEQLGETFSKPYWDEISQTTLGDAERYLRQGLQDGWSIRRIAETMSHSFMGHTGKYAKMRATRIARTEAGHALNGARRKAIDGLAQEMPGDVSKFMRPTWLSVLGNTTRDSHASLHGVPADEEGLWSLGGVRVPWPGHVDLPANERCNCQCSITMELGMDETEAQQLISDYNAREQIE